MFRRTILLFNTLFVVATLSACTAHPSPVKQPPARPTRPDLILATTTSTQDSGLLDELIPSFEQKTGYRIKVIAIGTGQALKMGEQCNADVLLVHAPFSERTFMESGFGADRKLVMHNDFILVGPTTDPAGIKGLGSAVEAFKRIAAAKGPFVSRGDDSGTHKMEMGLWKKAEVTAEGEWYFESGQGMSPTLKIASEKQAYTLTDRATYLANRDSLALDVLVEGDPALLNIYHVITVNPARCHGANMSGAAAFTAFLVSEDTQNTIASYGVEKYGQPLFFPDANKTDAELGLP